MTTSIDEKQAKEILKKYLDGDSNLKGVMLLVSEKEQRIELLSINMAAAESFFLLMRGLDNVHEQSLKEVYEAAIGDANPSGVTH